MPIQASSCLTAKLRASYDCGVPAGFCPGVPVAVPVVDNPVLCHIAVYLYHCTAVLASPKPTLLLGDYTKQVVEEVMHEELGEDLPLV